MGIVDLIAELESEIVFAKRRNMTASIIFKMNMQLGSLRLKLKELKESEKVIENKATKTVYFGNKIGAVSLSRCDSEKILEKKDKLLSSRKLSRTNSSATLTRNMTNAHASSNTSSPTTTTLSINEPVSPDPHARSTHLMQTISKNAIFLKSIPGVYIPTKVVIDEIANSPEKKVYEAPIYKPYSKNEKEVHIMGKSESNIPCVVQSKRKSTFTDKHAGMFKGR